MSDTIYQINNLKKVYEIKGTGPGKKYLNAVDDITFDVKAGETLGVVGESGSGKTTVLKLLSRIEEPTSGEIIFNDKELKNKDIFKLNNKENLLYRRDVQMIFQDPYSSLNPRWKVGEIISEPLVLNNMENLSESDIKDKVYSIMKKTGVNEEWYDRYPHEFSGGQRQRISIARSLVLNPSVILCDEPVSALDVSIQAQILNLLMELQEEFKLTYVFITHDLSVVSHISDRLIIMEHGKLIEKGTVEEVFDNPKDEYTKKLLNAMPNFEHI